MKLHRLTATFGRLAGQSLELGTGLNILEAPNEYGKSTWCAFLLSMLYGIDSRQRDKAGFIADKNRYTPWSGAPMSGRMDCCANGQKITLTRETRRPNAPMGHFAAQYTGSGDAVPGLTAQNCGDILLGVPREVYERSAFIRQASLSLSPSAELERRILSLITTGDENTSYTEACTALKKQLNRRKHNKTGEIPAAEAELQELRRQLAESHSLHTAHQQATQELNAIQQQVQQIDAQLALHKQHDAQAKSAALTKAKQHFDAAAATAAALAQQLEADRIPENETIARLRGAIVNLETTRKSLAKARLQRDDAAKALLIAETVVNNSSFPGMAPEQAEKLPLPLPPKPRFPLWTIIPFAATACVTAQSTLALLDNLYASIGCGCTVFAAAILVASLLTARKRRRWETTAAELRQQRQQKVAEFRPLHQQLLSAQADLDKKSAAADALYHTLSANEQAILLDVRRFAPTAFDHIAADTALRDCAVRRKAAADADAAAQDAKIRWEVLRDQADDAHPVYTDIIVDAPISTKEELEAELTALQSEAARRTSDINRLAGQLSAVGDPAAISNRIEELEETLQSLTREYDAISLAMDTLDSANAALQTRFSPALGRRAASIFQELTENRYSSVILDRSFHLAAEPTGDTVYRDAQLLSAGAADQLYLAVRLAICETVLPGDTQPPMVLDDALANYDDTRCEAALRWLRKEAEHRQILLFTCHSREANFFRNDPEVHIQRLTEHTHQV